MRTEVMALAVITVSLGCETAQSVVRDAGGDIAMNDDVGGRVDTGGDVVNESDNGERVDTGFVRTPAPVCEGFVPRAVRQCGTGVSRRGVLGENAEIDAKARRYDRLFHAVIGRYTGVNAEAIANDDSVVAALEHFVRETDEWDYARVTGTEPARQFRWDKVAGAYAGAGVMADALRYAVLRDEGGECEELARARENFHAAMDGMHDAVAVTGVPGVIARGFLRRDIPGAEGITTTPLRDAMGRPLPIEKNNGTWREAAQTGPREYIWEDSCSRDMLIGWVLGMAAAWEVSRGDATVDPARVETLRGDALAIGQSLQRVNSRGYDLEIHDADGRVTYNGYLSEHAVDRVYIPGFDDNGQHALMALGIVSALARITDDPGLRDWLHNDLIRRRNLPGIARDRVGFIDVGEQTNFSNYNMAFTGAWLAQRYLCDDTARAAVREATVTALYDTPGAPRQPAEMGQSFFDLVALQAMGDATAWRDLGDSAAMNSVIERAQETLREFADAPFWERPRVNCDETEITAGRCVGIDGTEIVLSRVMGRGGTVVATEPIPMRIRPASNYYWRSDPYVPNGDGLARRVLPGVDFRLAYWMGRYLRRR